MVRFQPVLPPAIGRYEILGELATGGMAEILLGRVTGPSGFRRPVVIKRILRPYARVPSFVTMFLDEARVVASMHHPNVIQVQDLGQDEGEPFLVMEYVAGENASGLLKRLVARGEEMAPALAAHIVAEACAGLHVAHELTRADGSPQKLVHRDVSPQNLLVTYDGHVKVLDFGVALSADREARTEAGQLKGKLEYMSPEQVRGEPLDRRSDLFSLGVVLYELSTGRRLFQRTGHVKTIEALCTEPIVPPSRLVNDYPRRLEQVCLRALSRDRDERYATAAEMRRDLLEVTRTLDGPTESLAALMQGIFADRIVEKDEMLRRVGDGGDLTSVPANETDDGVDVPNVTELLATLPRPTTPHPRAPLAIAVAFLVAVAAALLGVRAVSQAPSARSAPPLAPAAPVASVVVPAPSPNIPSVAGSAPPVIATAAASAVSVRVESKPSGARVVVSGEEWGETPLDLKLRAGAAPVRIELHRGGYRPLSQQVVPDRDQKLVLALQPLPATAGRTTARPLPSAAPAAPASGFRRFD